MYLKAFTNPSKLLSPFGLIPIRQVKKNKKTSTSPRHQGKGSKTPYISLEPEVMLSAALTTYIAAQEKREADTKKGCFP